ncbi:hypothetical protein TD95_002187 [Thielaviopsis punctulata]|uniref:RWD domain-containing protein n=1 Tax=Thielaviopsis punctulata TaxID=72032 RepID=A0A0F4ZFZ3_9PEZI|nr:hypothetical protein TD95_002187 [Thielaviopsis punctulata]
MNPDFLDEIEAINAIYDPDTLVSGETPGSYVLRLPSTNTSLHMFFPETYPATSPPTVTGLHSAGDLTKRGSGTHDLELFQTALSRTFHPGDVCLYNAIEVAGELIEEESAAAAAEAATCSADDDDDVAGEGEHASTRRDPTAIDASGPPPPWTLSAVFTENKSTFLARAAPVSTPDEAVRYIAHLLATDRKVRAATHNMTAWRIGGDGGGPVFQDCDDDGETAAGSRMLKLLQIADVWNVVVVVSRWYGGLKLGPRRFALINNAARDALVKGGWLAEKETGKKKR